MSPNHSDPRLRLAERVASRVTPTVYDVRRLTRRRLLAAAAWSALLTLLFARRFKPEQASWVLGSVVVFGSLALLTAFYTFNKAGSTLGRSRVSMAAAAVIAIVLPVVSALAAGLLAPSEHVVSFRIHVACLVLTSLVTLGPLVALYSLRRRSEYVAPGITAMLLGALAGSIGGVGISLHCAETDWIHLIAGHALPVVVLGLLGLVIGRRILAGRI